MHLHCYPVDCSSSLLVLNETAESHYFQVWTLCRHAPMQPWISSLTPAKDRPLRGCSQQTVTGNSVEDKREAAVCLQWKIWNVSVCSDSLFPSDRLMRAECMSSEWKNDFNSSHFVIKSLLLKARSHQRVTPEIHLQIFANNGQH